MYLECTYIYICISSVVQYSITFRDRAVAFQEKHCMHHTCALIPNHFDPWLINEKTYQLIVCGSIHDAKSFLNLRLMIVIQKNIPLPPGATATARVQSCPTSSMILMILCTVMYGVQ